MKSITLIYDTRGFQSAEASGVFFTADDFRKECARQNLSGSREVVLRIVLHVQRFVVIPVGAGEEDFFACHFPSHGLLASCPLGDQLQKIVYEVPDGLQTQLSAVLPRCFIIPDCALMARYALYRSSLTADNENDDVFVVYCGDNVHFAADDVAEPAVLSLFLAHHGILTFANAFQTSSLDEVRYFVLAVKQKFCNGNRCLLCSDWGSMPSFREMLQPYFEPIEEVSLVAAHSEPFMGLFSDIIL